MNVWSRLMKVMSSHYSMLVKGLYVLFNVDGGSRWSTMLIKGMSVQRRRRNVWRMLMQPSGV